MAEIGSTLREARMRAHIDITEVETRTKIRAKYLRAMENEEWDLLPGPVYVKSFLRTYGDFLGLDSRLLIDDFKRRYERPSDQERPVATLHRERERAARGPLVPPWAIIGLVLVVVVVALYILGSGNKTRAPSPTGARSTPRHRLHRRPRSRPAAATAARAQSVALQLVPTGSVYVCLVDGSGRKLIPGRIFAPGQHIPLQRGSQLRLTLGNASVQMKVDGAVVHVPPSGSSIGFALRPGAVSPLPAARQPRCA